MDRKFFQYFKLLCAIILVTVYFTSCTKEPATGGGGNGGGSPLAERIIMDTAYGTDAKQKMDIYLPAGRSNATKLLIMIHGGGWQSGDKADAEYTQAITLLRQKWPQLAIANINYRLTTNSSVHYNEIMSDVAAAVNFMVNNKSNFVTSDTLVLMGASAGAHLATLYTYKYNTAGYVKCVADFFGPVKLSDWDWYNSYNIWVGQSVKDVLTKFNGAPWDLSLYDSNSPYSVATALSKPTIIFHGTIDVIVPIYQSQWFKARLTTLGVPNEYYEYFDGHGFNSSNMNDAVTKSVAFFKAHLK